MNTNTNTIVNSYGHIMWHKAVYRELKLNQWSNSLEYQYAEDDFWIRPILSKFKASGKEEVIIVNIGTDKCTGDSFAPFLGSLLELQGSKFKYYGTLEDPIHALNVQEKIEFISQKHKNAFVIAVDSSVSEEEYVKGIYILNHSVEPGSALCKELESVGDISIVYNCCEVSDNVQVSLASARLGDIFKAAKDVYAMIKKLEEYFF